ncbi:MAG: signal peptidase II [Actinobacteria bacterium]|nr:signal peptidase II [Actinomycetota bacterium]
MKWAALVITIAFAMVVDLVTKNLAENHLVVGEVHKVFSFFSLERTTNSGVAFGLLGGRGAFIIVANVIALIIVLLYVVMERRPLLAGVAGGLIIGGTFGNLVQRLSGDGRVTDFLKLPWWPNFNMADVFLVVGICAIVIGLVLEAIRIWKIGRSKTAAPR